MISDAWARRTAAEWHGGQSSALYMLASSGATHDAWHGLDDLLDEITAGSGHVDADLLTGGDLGALADLCAYVTAVGPRGPQQGWAALPWPDVGDPLVAAYTAAGAALRVQGWALTGSAHRESDWLDFTDHWAAALTRHGHRAAVVRGPDGGPAAWAGVDHRLGATLTRRWPAASSPPPDRPAPTFAPPWPGWRTSSGWASSCRPAR